MKAAVPEQEEGKSRIKRLNEMVREADTVIIGAGAGLSASAGFSYTGERFTRYFEDFIEKYGFYDMYSGGFYPFGSLEEYWAYWSRYIYINRYMDAPEPVYEDLLALVGKKDYFVLTTNVDHCFQKAGFDKNRLFYTQGDYGLWQCSVPCHNKTYDNKESVLRMVTEQKDGKIPVELIPYCPVCGKPMSMNLRMDASFVEDEGWHRAGERYAQFLRGHQNNKTLFFDLGTGFNTPGIIKYSFWQMAHEWKNAVYVCINAGEACAPKEIKERSICIDGDIGDVLKQV
ncbi:Sir2 silent information regulator family NAD-dependent deacetylase [Anaerolentibacter hominis]|uniref:SIR2 family NAD-dependent protein deacylase n=1 Tax=Anaerolentibacter hominis TaxID=3079009 RepID=UPI0031B8811D